MQAGRLRHRVQIQEVKTTRDAIGAFREQWSTVATVWADVRMLSGREQHSRQAGGEVASATHQVRMRWRELSVSNRIVHEGRAFDVVSAGDPSGRKRELVALCNEVVG